MNSDYKQFQVFNNIETLNTFTNLLSDNKIDFEVENNSKNKINISRYIDILNVLFLKIPIQLCP